MKAIITGGLGFVGKYLYDELVINNYEVFSFDVVEGENSIVVDLLNKEELYKQIKNINPDIIFHLAGQPDVGLSWKEPQRTFELNVVATINLLDAIRDINNSIKLVMIGSSDEYGKNVQGYTELKEDLPVNPQSPYAISKVAQEKIAQLYINDYNMNVCMTRSFNQTGKGQKKGFMIPDFASEIVNVEKGIKNKISVGNLNSYRDITHVKDAVRAYRLIGEKGINGEIYNVGSGKAYKVEDILNKLINMSTSKIVVDSDKQKLRISDPSICCCNHDKLTKDTGWEPELSIDNALIDVLNEWRNK